MNIPPDMTGGMNASVVQVMAEAGKAINDTFRHHHVGKAAAASGICGPGVISVVPSGPFDYIVSQEDLRHGQRVGNYSIEFRREGSQAWEVLVPPVIANKTSSSPPSSSSSSYSTTDTSRFRDRPDGNDPRDSHIGHKRIDVPHNVQTSGPHAVPVAEVRLTCISMTKSTNPQDPVHIRSLSLHRRDVPWERQL
jgi:hypothetical protein